MQPGWPRPATAPARAWTAPSWSSRWAPASVPRFIFNGELVPNVELGHLELDGPTPRPRPRPSAPRTRRPGLGGVCRAPAALLLPRGVLVLSRSCSSSAAASPSGAGDYLPKLRLATPRWCRRLEEQRRNRRRGPAIGIFRVARQSDQSSREPGGVPRLCLRSSHPCSLVQLLRYSAALRALFGPLRAVLRVRGRSLSMAGSKSFSDSKPW